MVNKARGTIHLAIVCGAVLAMAGQAQAGVLYSHGYGDNTLYRIDTDAQTVTVVGVHPGNPWDRHGPEIELSPTGDVVYMSNHRMTVEGREKGLTQIDATTGLSSEIAGVLWSDLPGDTNTATALGFVGSTLYGSFHRSGPETNPGYLATIDTATGSVTTIGEMTGMNRPAGGLEFVDGVMYSVTTTDNNDSRLFTIDLATGAATAGAFLTVDGTQWDAATALAYADGKMYTVTSSSENESRQDSNLYSVNLATGDMTAEFDLGFFMNSLTAVQSIEEVPEPGTVALLGLGLAGAAVAARRRRRRVARG